MSNVNASEIVSSMGESPSSSEHSESGPVSAPEASVTSASEPQEYQPEQQQKHQTEDLDFSRRFNALTRREKLILEKDQEVKQRYSEIQEYQKEKDLLKSDPVGFLEKHGWKFNDLADFVLNDRKLSPERQMSELQKKIDQLENERKREKEETETSKKTQKYQETITNYKKQIKEFVDSKADDFELINQFGEHDTIYDVIENYYNQHGTILEVEKAAREVEKYLESQLDKAASTRKFKSRFSAQASEEPKSEGEPVKPKFPPQSGISESPRTLTNETAYSGSASASEKVNYLSDEESKARAADFLRQAWSKQKERV